MMGRGFMAPRGSKDTGHDGTWFHGTMSQQGHGRVSQKDTVDHRTIVST